MFGVDSVGANYGGLRITVVERRLGVMLSTESRVLWSWKMFGSAEGYTRRGAASRRELNYDPELLQ